MSRARLLLDDMLTSTIARQLRDKGHDVIAVTERPDLVSLPDERLLAIAAGEDRALVTLNIGDFAVLNAQWAAAGRAHAGLVFVPSGQFPQDRSFVGALVASLDRSARDGTLPHGGEAGYLRR